MSVFTCPEVSELREILGQGEEGIVYAYKTYAIKVVKNRTNDEILKLASDAGVSPRYYGTQECDGMFYIVHERLPRQFHETFVSQLPELIVRTLEAGIIHNDYRTNNMMADSKGELKFIDFGNSFLVRLYGNKRFDSMTKNATYLDDATHREIPIVFTPEQIARIQAIRPTVEKTDYEKDKEAELERIKAKIRSEMLERSKSKIENRIQKKGGRYISRSRRKQTRKRKTRRST